MKSPNVLLIAHSCEPGRGSEWGTSWAFVNEMARHQPVWVIVHSDCRERLDAHLRSQPSPFPIHVKYVEMPRWLGWMRNSAYALHNIHYYLWQGQAGRMARAWHREVGFDVVQHISYSRWWMASAGAALVRDGVKFIFGPCVGGESIPKCFRNRVPWRARWSEFQRHVARFVWQRDPALARCIRGADIVVGGTPASIDGMSAYGPRRIEVLTAAMITDTSLIDAARPLRESRRPDHVLRVCSVGGALYTRGIDLILKAIAQSGIEQIHYTHCCGGPALESLKRLAVELGIAHKVTFTGETNQARNLQYVAASDVLVHLALRDSQGVVPEALALGVPVIALDHHSMSPILDDTVGHKVPMDEHTTPESVIADVARTLQRYSQDRTALARLSRACVARSQELSPAYRVALFRRWHAELAAQQTNEPTYDHVHPVEAA
jgi:glycosyltransferase involved in cell wall biosynthesis